MSQEQIQVPKGWETARFGDIIELKHGHQFRTNDFVKSETWLAKLANVIDFGVAKEIF